MSSQPTTPSTLTNLYFFSILFSLPSPTNPDIIPDTSRRTDTLTSRPTSIALSSNPQCILQISNFPLQRLILSLHTLQFMSMISRLLISTRGLHTRLTSHRYRHTTRTQLPVWQRSLLVEIREMFRMLITALGRIHWRRTAGSRAARRSHRVLSAERLGLWDGIGD